MSKDIKSAEEILRKSIDNHFGVSYSDSWWNDELENNKEIKDSLSAMEEYASQFKGESNEGELKATERLSEMISKVHDDMEGRYDLTGDDLHEIQHLLCLLQPKVKDPRDLGLDDEWIHDVDMGAR